MIKSNWGFLQMSKRTIGFIVAITVIRAYLAAKLQLHPDETYYRVLSRYLDLSYYDHQPMVAYFIRLTRLFSDGEFFVRFSAIVASIFLSILIWKLADEMFNSESVSFWSVVILNIYPVVAAGTVITPDVPSFIFWGVCVFIFWRLVNSAENVKARKYWFYLGTAGWENVLVYPGTQVVSGEIFLFLIGIVAFCIFLVSRDEKNSFSYQCHCPCFCFSLGPGIGQSAR